MYSKVFILIYYIFIIIINFFEIYYWILIWKYDLDDIKFQ